MQILTNLVFDSGGVITSVKFIELFRWMYWLKRDFHFLLVAFGVETTVLLIILVLRVVNKLVTPFSYVLTLERTVVFRIPPTFLTAKSFLVMFRQQFVFETVNIAHDVPYLSSQVEEIFRVFHISWDSARCFTTRSRGFVAAWGLLSGCRNI